MKNQALFSSTDKSKKLKCHLLNFFFFFFGALKVTQSEHQTKHQGLNTLNFL